MKYVYFNVLGENVQSYGNISLLISLWSQISNVINDETKINDV